jgi:serine protease Do
MSEDQEPQRFEPLPVPRAPWKSPFPAPGTPGAMLAAEGSETATPERWFEPMAADSGGGPGDPGGAGQGGPGRKRQSAGLSRGLAIVLVVTSLIAALLGAGGTFLAMRSLGAFDATAAPADGQQVSVESDSSTVIAAVKQVNKAVVQILASDGQGDSFVGAGIVYDVRGWVLTNRHVVEGAQTITVRLWDDRRVAGSVYGLDTLTDLAIVKLQGATDIWSASIGDSSSLRVGQLAIAIGSPLGLAYPNSVSAGIVSALSRDIDVPSGSSANATVTSLHGLIQTDAAINPGNSGGPLVDSEGRVIGVTTAQASVAQGIGFAIPINTAKPIMQQALAGEQLSRPFIGISYVLIDKGLQQEMSLPLSDGAWVHREDDNGNSIEAVTAGSPADKAGIKTGDIITSIEGQAVDGMHRLEDLLVQYAPGRTISLQVYRNGQFLTIPVTLGTRPENLS